MCYVNCLTYFSILFFCFCYVNKEFVIDWRNDGSIRMFLTTKISNKNIQMRKIVSQAIELMSTEEIKSNIQNLDNGGFDISNQTSKEQLKAYLVKLVRRIRKTYNQKSHRKRKRDKADINPSRTKNILISPSGLKKKRQDNERQKRQRSRKRVKKKRLLLSGLIPLTLSKKWTTLTPCVSIVCNTGGIP